MTTTDNLFALAVVASIGVHLLGLMGASSLGWSMSSPAEKPPPVPIHVVKESAPEPPARAAKSSSASTPRAP